MKINPFDGRILQGIAGVPASIDDVPIVGDCCGDWDWIEPTNAAGQVCIGPSCWIQDQHGTRLLNEGPYHFRAGRGRWAAWTAESGLVTNFGLSARQNKIPIASDPESGDIAILEDYQGGRGISIYRADGSVIPFDVPVEFAHTRTHLKAGVLSYVDKNRGARIVTYNGVDLPFVRTAGADWVIGVLTSEGLIILERDAAGVAQLRRGNSAQAINFGEPAYSMDIVPIGSGVKVAWGRTQGEEPGNVGSRLVALGEIPGAPEPVPNTGTGGATSPAPATPSDVRTAIAGGRDSDVIMAVAVAGLLIYIAYQNRGE